MQGMWGRSLAAILFCAALLHTLPAQSQDLVTQAWQAWETNDHKLIEERFLAALQADAKNVRAGLGLALLYNLQGKTEAAWTFFQRALENSSTPYPYIFSAWTTPKLRANLARPQSGAFALLERLTTQADADGILKAMANDVLAEQYLDRGEIAKATRHYQNLNAIKTWAVIGPFDNISASGYDNIYPPELEYDADRTYQGQNGIPAKWFPITATRNDAWIDHLRYFAYTSAVYYGNVFVYSPQKHAVQVRVGTSGSLKAFLNDELLLENFDENNNDLDTYIVATELQAGWNRLLIKCGYSEINQCNFAVRLTDGRGDPIPGLKFDTALQPYPSRPNAPRQLLPNFAETYFQRQIQAHPEHLENYALLADCYLRNDKAIEAELTLREAIARAPHCVLFQEMIIEAYRRGEKYDEVSTVIEKIYALDKSIPSVLDYKIDRYLDNQDYAPAEELMRQYAQLLPGSIRLTALNIAYYTRKQQFDKVIELAETAYRAHPDVWEFAYLQSAVALQATRKYEDAIKVIETYLKRHYTKTALTTLADFYLKASNVLKWEETFRRALVLDPAATGYYYKMTEIFSSLRRYDQAQHMIEQALAICPNSSLYWEKLGEIKRIQGNNEGAKQAYREALRFRPSNYDAREVLRELEGKKSVFTHFETANISELVRTAPQAEAYPDNHGVVLLSDIKRVVYEQGASESQEEQLVKLFDSDGISAFKEYWIGYNSFTETLTIDKAVVLKKDGSEIEADLDDNHVVFKSLEENDCIYMKWRIKNYYNGKLSNHFWDTFYFNGFYPIKKMSYTLLVPEELKFQYKAQNMTLTPKQRKTEDGMLYQWAVQDEPAVVYEVGMPSLLDVGKVLHLSSIANWDYLVQWYSDLARTKTRGSHEIKAQVAKLFEGREALSEEERIRTIYDYITENIRYSNVSFRQSRLIPQEARDVLVSKIGDCKDMTTLCIAMLKEVGIEAHYLLLNTKDAGYNREILPGIAFNHCIAGVQTRRGLQYLDLTAANYALGTLPELDIDGFSLLIRSDVKMPHYLPRRESRASNSTRKHTVHLREDNSILVEGFSRKTGALAADMRARYRLKGQKEREKHYAQALSDDFLNPKVIQFQIDSLEYVRAAVRYDYAYEVANYATEAAQLKLMKLPWADALNNQEGLSYDSRKFPYQYWLWADTLQDEVELRMPAGWAPTETRLSYHDSCAAGAYSIQYRFANGILRAQRRLICKERMISPEIYADFKRFYSNLVREDTRQIVLQKVVKKTPGVAKVP